MKAQDIKKLAEEMRQMNGNKNISQADMLWYLIKKIDDMDSRLDNTVTKEICKEHRTNNFNNKGLLISIIALIVSIIATVWR